MWVMSVEHSDRDGPHFEERALLGKDSFFCSYTQATFIQSQSLAVAVIEMRWKSTILPTPMIDIFFQHRLDTTWFAGALICLMGVPAYEGLTAGAEWPPFAFDSMTSSTQKKLAGNVS